MGPISQPYITWVIQSFLGSMGGNSAFYYFNMKAIFCLALFGTITNLVWSQNLFSSIGILDDTRKALMSLSSSGSLSPPPTIARTKPASTRLSWRCESAHRVDFNQFYLFWQYFELLKWYRNFFPQLVFWYRRWCALQVTHVGRYFQGYSIR